MTALIQIQPASDELIPGQPTTVPIVLVLSEPLRVRGLHATFHGAEETKAVYTTSNGKTTQTHTAIEYVDIVKTEYHLSGRERRGFFGNMADACATLFGGGEHDVLEPGEYPFEVQVQVPADARSSFAGKKCRVFYELAVHADVPLGRDVKQRHSFRVADAGSAELPPPSPVRTRYPEDQKRGLLDAWLEPQVRVEAALEQGAFRDGDTIRGIFSVETPQPLTYRAINVRVITVEQSKAHGHKDSHTHLADAVTLATNGTIEGQSVQRFELPASFPGPPTTSGRLFSIDSFVQIELDVPWAKDPKIRVPITRVG